jgi:putative ATPase
MAAPLADVLRPKTLDEFIGQEHLMGLNAPLRKIIESGEIPSMIFWGPPGCGKTTLARLIPNYTNATFIKFSAIGGSIKDVRSIIADAEKLKNDYQKETILFVDEIHRFNKSQQDAFLPAVENGTIILIGATTENPGFEINAPLISRSQIFMFKQLTDENINTIIQRIKTNLNTKWDSKIDELIISFSNGDARKAINAVQNLKSYSDTELITLEKAQSLLQKKLINYDKKGDNHYDTISAFIKSMRGSEPDATLHYLARMLSAGEDPVFIARRMVIFASEDIGNAKPNALVLATSAMQAVNMIGMPEAQIILAQCATYLATCPKSIASYMGINQAMADIQDLNLDPIPLHLRNASNKVMKQFGYNKEHIRYPWIEKKKGKQVKQEYMPKNLSGRKYYKFEENSENIE